MRSFHRTLKSAGFGLALLASIPAHAVTGVMYDFIVTKNGVPFFLDSFADGSAPPSAPNFASGNTATYLVGGNYVGAESGGQLNLNSANGLVGSNALGDQSQTQRATLLSNNDPLNTTNGLKPNHTFTVSALVDIGSAAGSGSIGIRLSDRGPNPNNTGALSEFVSVDFIPTTSIVRWRRQDFVTDQIFNLGSMAVPVGAEQVRLILSHPLANDDAVLGSAEFFDNGESMGVFALGGVATIFNYHQFTRAEFAAGVTLAPIPEPSTYAMLLVGVGLVGWQLRRKTRVRAASRFS